MRPPIPAFGSLCLVRKSRADLRSLQILRETTAFSSPDKSHLSDARSITQRTRSADTEKEGACKRWEESKVTTVAQRKFLRWNGRGLLFALWIDLRFSL